MPLVTLDELRAQSGRQTIAKSANARPAQSPSVEEGPKTVGELAADRPSQQAQRELMDRKAWLERRQQTLHTEFFSYQTSRTRQAEVAAELDRIQSELNSLRDVLAPQKPALAKTDGTSRRRARNALDTVLHGPHLAKAEDAAPIRSTLTKTQAPLDGPEIVVEDDLGNLIRL